MQTLAEAISSAGNPELAEWQERGLTPPGASGSIVVWSIFIGSGAVGLAAGVGAWRGVWHSLAPLRRPVAIGVRHMQDPAILVLLGALLAVSLAAAVGFALFQGLTRIAFARRSRTD